MGRSLSLAAYTALSRRVEPLETAPYPDRPRGELVWIHAAEPNSMLAIQDLAQRMCNARPGLFVLISVSDEKTLRDAMTTKSRRKTPIDVLAAPSEHPQTVGRFLSHWDPDMCLWAWGGLRPNLLAAAIERKCPVVLIDGDSNGFDGRRDRWLPEVNRGLLSEFSAIMVRSGAGAQRLRSLGIEADKLELIPPLQAGGQALPCTTRDLDDLSKMLVGRSVWLATGLHPDELDVVLSAHRQSLRLSHRLLLILNPSKHLDPEICLAKCAENGFRTRNWGAGEVPDDTTQILLADDPEDLGLFYRVAPVSFLGSSLASGQGGRNPFEAAALGSAVLYGPNVRQYLPFYTRLANAGAARIVNDAQSLSTAVTRLVAPDQAAAMAHAGWDVISQGAEQTDKIIALVQDMLDLSERGRR